MTSPHDIRPSGAYAEYRGVTYSTSKPDHPRTPPVAARRCATGAGVRARLARAVERVRPADGRGPHLPAGDAGAVARARRRGRGAAGRSPAAPGLDLPAATRDRGTGEHVLGGGGRPAGRHRRRGDGARDRAVSTGTPDVQTHRSLVRRRRARWVAFRSRTPLHDADLRAANAGDEGTSADLVLERGASS